MQSRLIGVATPAGSLHGTPQALILLLKTMKSTGQDAEDISAAAVQCMLYRRYGLHAALLRVVHLCVSCCEMRFSQAQWVAHSQALWSGTASDSELTLRLAMVRSAAAMRRVNSSCSSCSSASVAAGCLPAED